MLPLRQSTDGQVILLSRAVDSTDGNTEETALTIANTDIKIWKHNATAAVNKNSGGATHAANGDYYCTLDATDTNTVGRFTVLVHVTGMLYLKSEFVVYPQKIYDSLFAGTDNLEVDTVQVSGDSTAADNLEAACDGTGYNVGGGSVVAASVTGNVGGNVTGSVGSVAAGGITAASIATSAIDSDAIAADAVIEIQSGLATASALSTIAGYLDTEIAAILEDTGTTIPAQISGLNNLSSAQAQSAAAAALEATITEPDDLTNLSAKGILYHLFSRFFHRNTQTATAQVTYKANGTTALATRTASDDGTTQELGKAT